MLVQTPKGCVQTVNVQGIHNIFISGYTGVLLFWMYELICKQEMFQAYGRFEEKIMSSANLPNVRKSLDFKFNIA